ncbi:MAG TPA: hypothetical protein VG077_16835 [Verrucomicrobiae bacterium]|nr:hypothetical protein [Verrucomicrobiae bacterium]
MKTVTVDDFKRIRLPDVKPRQKYAYENLGNGRISLTELEEKDVPLVKARKVNGRWMGAEVKLDRQAIVSSIREDRESR